MLAFDIKRLYECCEGWKHPGLYALFHILCFRAVRRNLKILYINICKYKYRKKFKMLEIINSHSRTKLNTDSDERNRRNDRTARCFNENYFANYKYMTHQEETVSHYTATIDKRECALAVEYLQHGVVYKATVTQR